MTDTEQVPATAIAKINDELRKAIPNLPFPHQMVLTDEVAALPTEQLLELLNRVRDYAVFDESDNPHGERDFGKIEMNEEVFFWKFDYYDKSMKYLQENGRRVLTIMFAHEY